MVKKISCLLIIILFIPLPVLSKHLFSEKQYQNVWCQAHNGIQEYLLPDKTRVDCLTSKYSTEVEYAAKFYEGIGQSLYYHLMTGKKPAIVLIVENPANDQKYLNRLMTVANRYKIMVWVMKPEDLKGK